ncbi:N-acetylmuramoyl-L-alanine amidase [Prevotella copri]|uniref:N-acetylmuramoyl-L-alanine amidase n=1 Tax=Segatella copri TaxID=165179 RepID=A0AA91A339_9BACT|nr:N-acetylmuramoyl-L-alanine amidase [Segatella copri]MQO09278.1 N-acetylmuramoyl-L-alanine amidase [Segatella copri]
MRKINEIIVHCTATAEGKNFKAADIDRWHKAKGWNGIGYHHVVDLDGTVEPGRPENEVGAHCLKHNANSIGVVYVGGLASDGKTPKDTRTPQQKAALVKLLTELKRRYPNATIHGHRDFAAKACPSFDATKEYKDIK